MRDELTHESLTKQFGSSFELALVATAVARHAIKSGRQISVEQILEELRRNPLLLEDMIAQDAIIEEPDQDYEDVAPAS